MSEERRKRNNERYKRLRDEKKKKLQEHEALCSYLRENCPNVLKRFHALRCSAKNLPSPPNLTTSTLQTPALQQMASATNPSNITNTTTLKTPVLWQTDLTSSISSSLKPEESPSLDFAAPGPNVYDEEDDIITADLSSLLDDPFLTNPNNITTTTTPQTPVLRQTNLTSSMSSSLKPEQSPSLDFAAPVPNVYDEDDDIITADLSSLLDDPSLFLYF